MIDERIQTSPVQVEIKNWTEGRVEPKGVKKTTLKTWVIDPAGAVGGKNVQIADYEPKRLRTVIQVLDAPVALLLDAPIASPDTSIVGIAPQGLLLPPSTIKEYVFLGPDALWINSLTQTVAGGGLVNPSGVTDVTTGVFAATVGGNIFPPAAGESVSQFTIDFQAPAAAVNADITLTNVLGGTQTFRITVPTTGLHYVQTFNPPLPAATAAAFPNVVVPAIAAGPAYSIMLQSLKTTQVSRVLVTKEYC